MAVTYRFATVAQREHKRTVRRYLLLLGSRTIGPWLRKTLPALAVDPL